MSDEKEEIIEALQDKKMKSYRIDTEELPEYIEANSYEEAREILNDYIGLLEQDEEGCDL